MDGNEKLILAGDASHGLTNRECNSPLFESHRPYYVPVRQGKISAVTTRSLSVSKINSLGCKAETNLASGISETYQGFLVNEETFKR